VRVYRVAFNDNRIFAFAQFDASDPGGEQERSGEALSFFSRQPMTALGHALINRLSGFP
jgi:hypothetical protein